LRATSATWPVVADAARRGDWRAARSQRKQRQQQAAELRQARDL
jgi:hypothetical protein